VAQFPKTGAALPRARLQGENDLVATADAGEHQGDQLRIGAGRQLSGLGAQHQITIRHAGVQPLLDKTIAAILVELAAHAEAEAAAVVLAAHLELRELHRHREALRRVRELMRQGVNTPVAAEAAAFGAAVGNPPILHRIGPEIAAEKDPVMGPAPSVGGRSRAGALRRGGGTDGGGEQFQGGTAGKKVIHGEDSAVETAIRRSSKPVPKNRRHPAG